MYGSFFSCGLNLKKFTIDKKRIQIRNIGCLPFTRKFWKFLLEYKWETVFWFVQLENPQNEQIV